jgi:hypothetical protein
MKAFSTLNFTAMHPSSTRAPCINYSNNYLILWHYENKINLKLNADLLFYIFW